ncbi:unnamed protein product [Meloidogyne enterolobii]|uniref:Uncharacterized protein n=1 Tax=Meloidogyne enterolobii TaxID=390850 RepID=A0ACB1ASC2_MELEN
MYLVPFEDFHFVCSCSQSSGYGNWRQNVQLFDSSCIQVDYSIVVRCQVLLFVVDFGCCPENI